MFNKQMGGGSGSASVYEAKRALGKTDSNRDVSDCIPGMWYYLGWSNLPACKLFFECFIKILSLLGLHVVMSVVWGSIQETMMK